VLDEMKKYFGMPAAPKVTRISDDEITRDLALMKVPPSPAHLVPAANFSSNDRIQDTK